MKVFQLTTLLLLIGLIAPCCAQAQKYHDAAIEDAKGPVKTIKEGTRTLQYSPEGKLLSINGVVPYEEETRNDQGYLCAAKGDLYNGSFQYNANNRLSVEHSYKLFGGGHYTYTYNSEGQCARCDILEDGVPTIIIEYSAIRTDSHGNWIERKSTTKALNERTGEWDIQPAKTQTRTITYYENSPAAPATPAVKPQNVSIVDFVRHPLALASLSGNVTYNEAKTVEKVVTDFRRVLPEATIYVYDNNSTDGTAELAVAAGAVVRHEYQQGKGNVMRRMFREIDAEAYVLVDGDDTYPAEAAPEMVRAVTQRQADMVVGDRLSSTYYTQNKRPFHNFGNDLVRFCTNHLFGGKIKDIMTGYRAFSYQFVKTYPVLSRGFEIETEMTIHALQRNMQVDNVVIEYRDRPEGSESKLNTYSDGFKVLGTILRLFKNYRPFTFFGVLAAVLAVFGIGFMIPVLNEYFHTGLVPRFPTLIVCCFVLVAALLLFVSGVILSSQLAKDARDFEFQLQTVQHWKRTAGE